jgi:hypothetical protein
MVILLLFLLPFIKHFSLAFFIFFIANLHPLSNHLFLNASVPSFSSISCCLVSLIVVLMFSYFFINIIVNTTFIIQIFQYFKLIIIFYSIFLFPLWILKNTHYFSFPIIFISSFHSLFHFKVYL